jgi:HSP20 family molecular chaperone IbpA
LRIQQESLSKRGGFMAGDKGEKEEKIKRLEEEKEVESKGVAGSVLEGLGDTIPGLGGLIKAAIKSGALQERLKEINEEVEVRLKQAPLKKTEGWRDAKRSHISGSIPGRTPSRRLYIKKGEPAQRMRPETLGTKDFPVDVFDEQDHLRIIAELPGIEEKDIKVDLRDDKLVISADALRCKYHRKISLPCSPKGEWDKAYRNGILEFRIKKRQE